MTLTETYLLIHSVPQKFESALDNFGMSVNLKTLSEELGLSQTTVSRALNGYPEVSEKTRARVEREAKRLGYSPNSRAKGLATGRSMIVGHVIPPSSRHEMVNPVFGDFVAGASQTLAEHGYGMMFARVGGAGEAETYRGLRTNGSVDGVILQGPTVDDRRIDMLDQLGLPFVVHGRSTGVGAPYSWVDVNNKSSFQRATEFLLQLGHGRIALLNGLEAMDFAHRRREGYVAALGAAGVPLDPALMHSAEMTEGYGYRMTRDLLALPDPPTAILSASLISAIGVRRAVQEAGLEVGTDVSIITHDDDLSYLGNGEDVPIFTATRSSVWSAGAIVAEFLIQKMQDPDAEPQTRLLEAELILGRSTGPARKS